MASVLHEHRRPIRVEPSKLYYQIGIRSHDRGVFTKEAVSGAELGGKKVFSVEPGDLVANIVFGWEGAVAVILEDLLGHCGSHRFPTYRRADEGPIDYMRHLLLSRRGIEILGLASPGGAGRNRTLNRCWLGGFTIPWPSLNEQRAASAALLAIEARLRAFTAELAALRRFRADLLFALL